MFRGKDLEDGNELKREGLSIRAISRLTGYDRRMTTKYLFEAFGQTCLQTETGTGEQTGPSGRT